ncbi:MAG: cytochrome c oxidase assembly protein [Nitriliruptor sp.]|uniref:cytochrome c oxidase assembly protein n=1 Tax=Nitriliruptor sp. TaxID=2448056 RepID=UPI0034A09948
MRDDADQLTMDDVWSRATADPAALAALAGVTAWYLLGQARRRRATGASQPRRTASFLVGVAVTIVAVAGPIAGWSAHLLWVHMVQHLLLTVVAAPLFAFGSPVSTLRLGLSPSTRSTVAGWSRRSRRLRRRLGDPPLLVVATVVHIALTWLWHAPWLYDLAVRNAAVHALEHVAFLGSAVWVWTEIVATARRNRRTQALATLCLAALIATGGVLGALLTFAGRSVYDVYTGAGGMTALEDQQFAGALMWVPPSFVYAIVALRRFKSWIDRAEQELRARERQQRLAAEREAIGSVVGRPVAGDRSPSPPDA